jgi:hypothetical protein
MPIYLNKLQAIKLYKAVGVKPHTFLTSMLDERECSTLHPGRVGPGRRATRTHWTQKFGRHPEPVWTPWKLCCHRHSLTELRRSWEAANCAATQEIPKISRNPRVHYRDHKSPPLVPILSQINPIHSIPSYFSKINFNTAQPPTSWFPSGLVPSDFPTNILYTFLVPHSCYMHCQSQHLALIILIIFGE